MTPVYTGPERRAGIDRRRHTLARGPAFVFNPYEFFGLLCAGTTLGWLAALGVVWLVYWR